MHLANLQSYLDADGRLLALYADPDDWTRRVILNVAASGKFSSDRTIAGTRAPSGTWSRALCHDACPPLPLNKQQ
jgi:starch phosphorylase